MCFIPFKFSDQNLYEFLISPIRATYAAHLILLDLFTLITLYETYKLCSSSLWGLLQSPVISCLLGPNILLSTLFSYVLNLCSLLSVTDQVSHPYETRCRIMVMYILIVKFLERRREAKDSEQNGSKHSLNLIYS
jgi:hypothetical protein